MLFCLIIEYSSKSLQANDLKEIIHTLCYGVKSGESYPESVREFCLAMDFYSPRAYRYMREKFTNNLPHPCTIRAWYRLSSINAPPGITLHSMEMLKTIAMKFKSKNSQLLVSLIMDEMHTRKHIQWSDATGQRIGFTNNNNIVTGALVFMVCGLRVICN